MNNDVPFNLDLTNVNISPYLYVENENRVRFDFDNINNFIINFIIDQFKNEELLNILYLSNVSVNKFSQDSLNLATKEYLNLYESSHLWEEKIINVIDDGDLIEYTFSEIKDVNISAVYDYYLYMKTTEAQDNYLYFYNKNFIINMNSDVLDIVTNNEEIIKNIKTSIISYDKYHE
ncbi:hypothetical protein [Nosocomiicoccus sp. HMSC09A07]|uniref:hypothetical protein n=1 Tax=Nosocomiicoccus sp. HMSC09A07 TaxID=1581145 RepID=UPI0008A1C28B|nr:hypothetical protein [Nosocomiicoccus sp. HMSC09A07]OFS61850.1 hypothetical protein HMPREF3177_07145 [Nosocomiicoccus sp. HMSC09A07]